MNIIATILASLALTAVVCLLGSRASHWKKAALSTPAVTFVRTTAVALERGDTVFVWAHPSRELSGMHIHDCDLWKLGTIDRIRRDRGEFLEYEITFDTGRTVYARPYALAFIVTRASDVSALTGQLEEAL